MQKICFALSICFFGITAFSGCSPADLDKSAAIDSVNLALSTQDCTTAYVAIEPFYDSTQTDNSVRLAAASTFGCFTGIRLLTFVDDLTNFSGNIGGSGFWDFLAQEFPSTTVPTDDKKPTAAMKGTDALMSTLQTGVLLVASDVINSSSYNPGSLLSSDRTQSANVYLTLMSMALIGTLQNRYGLPDSAYHRTVDLPWEDPTNTVGDGCAFASALLNLTDSLAYMAEISSSSVAATYTKIDSFLASALDQSCSYGCTVLCLGQVSCTSCPFSLRDRSSCTGSTKNVNSCAAAGIATFVNSSWVQD